MLVAKSDIIVDSITAGPLAAKLKAPILITQKLMFLHTIVQIYQKKQQKQYIRLVME